MKKIIFCAAVLAALSSVLFSCSRDSDNGGAGRVVIEPVSPGQKTTDFFNVNKLPSYKGPLNQGYPAIPGDSLCVVDSMEELRALAPDAGTLPEIDFERYTLIVGYVSFLSPGFSLEDQYISSDGNGLTLVVQYKYYSDILYERFDDMYVYEYYWGLYEKISEDTIAFYVKLHAVDSREE